MKRLFLILLQVAMMTPSGWNSVIGTTAGQLIIYDFAKKSQKVITPGTKEYETYIKTKEK